MGRLIVSEFVTVDGVAEDPGGSESFERGGWAFAFDRGPEGDKFKMDETAAAAALLLGRKTYEGFAEAWPGREGEFADKMNAMPKYVVSSTLTGPAWSGSEVLSGEVVPAVSALKERVDGDILVAGSMSLVATLLEHGLVDELRLMVFPIVLGAGKRLVESTAASAKLRLADSRPAGETFILTYVAG
jgi:dihydrofolate reductase